MYAYCNNNPVMYADYTGESLLALLAIVTTGVLICELVVSVIISDFSNEDESYDSAILGNTRDSDYGVLYYETHVDTILGETYRVGAEAGIYSESYSLDWIKANFDAGKADASLGYFGASAGVYFAEFSLEQTYKIFGKEVTLSLGANAGYGASLSFGKKTTIGASYGLGWVFSLEVI